ncbi:hypothetical protein E4T50_03620 [Aureobasidium sp. EXF-12298]|nr:hypothetical protein E4T50_03620 [Aureobasidium sp. EXF-12298]
MSSSSKGRRRSSLSAAFDHFRKKCRKTRIDSLLSPPKLDSGTSNEEEEDFSPSDSDGVPLTTGSSDQSPGQAESKDEDVVKKEKEEDEQSRCDSKLPQFIFDDDGFGDLELAAEQSNFTSPDEDERLLSALGDFSAEVTEPEDFGRYFSLSHQRKHGKDRQEEQISPTESASTGGANAYAASASSLTHLLHSDNSGSTLDFEVGVPLQRTAAKGALQREWTTQVQTEPQTQEQTLVQSTYASLDEIVKDTVMMKENETEENSGREKDVPVMRTVDGVRLDARPLIRHSGISAPPHSSLQLHEEATTTLKTATEASGATHEATIHRPQPNSWFSDSSESSGESMKMDVPSHRRRSTIKPAQPQPTTDIRTKRHQTTIEPRPRLPSYPPHISSITSAPRDTQPMPKGISYAHTPPLLTELSTGPNAAPLKPKLYTNLHNPSDVTSFHRSLNQKLDAAISTGAVKASQIGVKERVRRLSGSRTLQQGWEAGARRMSGWGREIGEAVVASGGVGVGWGDRRDEGDVGKRSAGVYYGGGFV